MLFLVKILLTYFSGRITKDVSMCAKSLQSCLTLCSPVDCSLPGSSVMGILQARILEWVAMPSSRGSSRPRDQTCLLHCRQILYSSATREAQLNIDSHNICESMILFSKTKVLFRHEIGPHSSSLPCEYLSGVGDGNKKKRMLDLCENKDQRILPSKTQAVFSFVFCTH